MTTDQVMQIVRALLQDNLGNRITQALANGMIYEAQQALAQIQPPAQGGSDAT